MCSRDGRDKMVEERGISTVLKLFKKEEVHFRRLHTKLFQHHSPETLSKFNIHIMVNDTETKETSKDGESNKSKDFFVNGNHDNDDAVDDTFESFFPQSLEEHACTPGLQSLGDCSSIDNAGNKVYNKDEDGIEPVFSRKVGYKIQETMDENLAFPSLETINDDDNNDGNSNLEEEGAAKMRGEPWKENNDVKENERVCKDDSKRESKNETDVDESRSKIGEEQIESHPSRNGGNKKRCHGAGVDSIDEKPKAQDICNHVPMTMSEAYENNNSSRKKIIFSEKKKTKRGRRKKKTSRPVYTQNNHSRTKAAMHSNIEADIEDEPSNFNSPKRAKQWRNTNTNTSTNDEKGMDIASIPIKRNKEPSKKSMTSNFTPLQNKGQFISTAANNTTWCFQFLLHISNNNHKQ
eukprot:m.22993 g.22993  ORF g.22993 m.22993 type:complete len:407 (-) comp5504_c0_seq1:1428-2648(-)